MTKKKRRQMKLTLLLSVMIAAVPVSLSVIFNEGNELNISMDFFSTEKSNTATNTSKVLPMLANK